MQRIVQTSTVTAILHHDLTYRQIFMDGRTLEPNPHPTWMGYSVGRWDGDTLVVETDGLNRGSSGSTAALRLTARFTRVGPETLEYEYTMSDPSTWTRPWTARLYMRPAPGTGVIYEFACHEGNYAIEHALRGARQQDAAAAGQ